MPIKQLTGIFIFVISNKVFSQDISSFKEQKPFDYSGTFNVNQNAAYRSLNTSNTNPYNIFLNGSASLNFYGISLPFSFSYSNQHINYSQPFSFNQFGVQPSYKWVKAYIGYNTMSFSPYSLNGHQFLGGGIEISPKELGLKVTAMYGRLVKGVEWDSTKVSVIPYYERYAFAYKMGYNNNTGNVEVSIFKSWDKTESINAVPDSIGLSPKDNMIYTLNLEKTFVKKIKVAAEFADNALTHDTRQKSNPSQSNGRMFFLINQNGTTSYAKAIKGNVDYLGKSFTIGMAYERVDPGYNSLGAYYTNNDIENIAITFSKQIIDGKINLSGSLGKQRNNLDKLKISSTENFLGSLIFSFVPGNRVTLNANYSNYSFYTYMRTPFDRINSTLPYQSIDTLNFAQISQSAQINNSIILGSLEEKDTRQVVSTNFSYQQSVNRQNGNNILGNSSFYQGAVTYALTLVPRNFTISSNLIGFYSKVDASNDIVMFGPSFGISKSFCDKKITTNTSAAYNLSYKNSVFFGDVFSVRISGGYSHQKTHKIGFSFCFIHKTDKAEIQKKRLVEFCGNINYSYSLSKQ